jgi:immune inhibitor A
VRGVIVVAALAALLGVLMAAPAGAAAPNEVLIARNLQRLGVIPPYANARMAAATVEALGVLAPSRERKSPLVQRTLDGKKTQLARFMTSPAVKRGATTAYVAKALVLLVEFGDETWPAVSPAPTGPMTPGPAHGQIPPPPADDNNTFWPGDFSPAHYRQELFGDSFGLYDAAGLYRGSASTTMRTWYLEQSHGAYTVSGDIEDWVKLDMPESWYGADSDPWVATDNLNGPVWRVARDAVARFAAEHPGFPWADYDIENPYGIAGTDFDQPDGIVDHLILVHAGSDQSAGGGAQGSDAIWAHSSVIYASRDGGPGGRPGYMVPGTEGQGPAQTGIWVSPYTINPEDGDPGVFCHEFAHDLGLPDEYDRVGTPGDGGGFWTLMAQGEWLGREWGLGSEPGAFNVWDKMALDFVSPKVVKRGTSRTVTLQAAATGSSTATGVMIPLPKRKHVVPLSGRDGGREWYSGAGTDLDARLTTTSPVNVPSGERAVLTVRTWYDIESGYDYGSVRISGDGGTTWYTAQSQGNTVEVEKGLWGLTGGETGAWGETMTFNLSAWAGKSVLVQFRYLTDGTVSQSGWEIADVAVGDATIPDGALTSEGWTRVDGQSTVYSDNYYMAEYRTRAGSDASLADCYEFDRARTNWVDWYAYDQGLLLIYRDTFWTDNDVAAHPGEGGWMVVDARPTPDGVSYGGSTGYWRPRIQLRDAAFSLAPTHAQSIYFRDYARDPAADVGERLAPGRPAAALFSDSRQYWFPQTPTSGVHIPARLGVRIRVMSAKADAMTIWVDNKR